MRETRNHHRTDNVELSFVAAIAEDVLRTDAIELKRRGDQQAKAIEMYSGSSVHTENRDEYYNAADKLRAQADLIGWKILERETR